MEEDKQIEMKERTFALDDIPFGAGDLAERVGDVALRGAGGYASGKISGFLGYELGKAISSDPSISNFIPEFVNQISGVQSTNEMILGTSALAFGAVIGGLKSGVRKLAGGKETEYRVNIYPVFRMAISYVDKRERRNEGNE